ncbi:hypothetical protein [Pelomicrobium sp. G1]|uniref:hypothetical protein n=1 Tax=unclassified Pelomicrobium TaxID=2815318 RepID=UPI0021DF12E9|nr:MAG: hypothetical protein KatS3mg123_1740 [Burkholderiales bacterium]
MTQLELSPEEREVLIEVLESFLSDLRMEIADTERLAFRERLKSQEQIIKRLLGALRKAP